MKKLIKVLSLILVVQIVLLVLVNLKGDSLAAFSSDENLVKVDLTELDKITIEEKDKETVQLVKEGDKWILPDYHNMTVSREKLTAFAEKLDGIKKSWPVATSLLAAKQLKLTKDEFNKKLSLFKGEEASVLYLGSSPGFKKVHARVDGDTESFAVDFNAFEASTKNKDWFDAKYLYQSRDEIKGFELNDFALERVEDQLQVTGLSDKNESIQKEVNALVSRASSLKYQEILGVEDKEEYKASAPELTYVFETLSGERWEYSFSKPEEQDYYVLKLSDKPFYFKIAATELETIKDMKRAALVQEKSKETETVEASEELPVGIVEESVN